MKTNKRPRTGFDAAGGAGDGNRVGTPSLLCLVTWPACSERLSACSPHDVACTR